MQNAIERVVYILIYPAVLGSMIYDMFNISSFVQTDKLVILSLILIILIYLMDFATNDGAISDLGQGKNTGWGMAVDVAAAFLFRYSYALIGSDHYLAALGCLILASVLFFGYRLINDQKFLPQIWATVVVMCGIWLSSYYSDFGIVSLLFGQAAMMTGFIWFAWTQRKGPEQAGPSS